MFNPRTYKQSHIPTVVQGGLLKLPPRVFAVFQYFEEILPLVESFWRALQDEVYIMGWGAAGGLWRHLRWKPYWPPSWILPKIRNHKKWRKLEIVNSLPVKYDIIEDFAAFCVQFVLFSPKNPKNTQFYPKMAWPAVTYDVRSRNHKNRLSPNFIKLCLRNMSTATVNGRFWQKIVLEKLKKNIMGASTPPSSCTPDG